MSKTPILPKVEVARPPSTNKDLSYTSRFSLAPGVLYPIMNKLLKPGDVVNYSITSLMKTLPPTGPLMGSFKVQLDTFFAPIRLYNKLLHDDRTRFDPSIVIFPEFIVNFPAASGNTQQTLAVDETSLLHFLGVTSKPYSYTNGNQGYFRKFNACKLLAYYDIFRGYYANTQEDTAYAITTQFEGGSTILAFPLSEFNTLREQILSAPIDVPFRVQVKGRTVDGRGAGPMSGLLLRTYLPDRFHTFVSGIRYDAINTATRVTVTSSAFSMDELRFADKLNTMLQKTLISGGRYSDWQRIHFGTVLRGVNEIPSFLGSSSYELQFEDIVQVSQTTEDNPLGTLGSVGAAFGRSRPIRYTAGEHGYLMTIMSLIPRVDYYQHNDWDLDLRHMGQLHVPDLDGIGFQDLLVDDFYSEPTIVNAQGEPINLSAKGKQPAWTEYTTSVNQLHGDFAKPGGAMYLTLARRFGFDSGAGTGGGLGNSTYIYPGDFNYVFNDSSLTSQNFWMQCNFNLRIRRHMSNHIMPHL